MKRLFVFILSLVYLVTTTGASMHLHYCMGKLADLSFWTKSQEKQCGRCGMEKSETENGCCQDEHKWIKIHDDQKTAFTPYYFTEWQVAEPLQPYPFDNHLFFTVTAGLLPQSHAPPRSGDIPIYKRNGVFRI